MMKRNAALLVFLMLTLCAKAQDEFEVREGDTVYVMKKYFLVLLMKGPNRAESDSLKLAEIQAGHMEHIRRMSGEGKLAIAGPMGDDGDLRGIFVLTVGSLEEADSLVAADPAVRAGRLRGEVHPWWVARGSRFP
jgi:uncharacterized protein